MKSKRIEVTAKDFEFQGPPGEYEVVCFIPTPTDRPHFQHGMHATFTVK